MTSEPSRKPTMKKIPPTMEELQSELAQDPVHPGLLLAYSSLQKNRHPFKATIVLLGITGAGKSSTINSLFNTEELAKTGEGSSISQEITEYTINLKLEDVGVSNAQLTIIDTPGFGDTGGTGKEAQILASMKHYFSTRHSHSPTCLVLASRFDDDRYAGPATPFVKTLKAVEHLREGQAALKNSPVVFVLTRLMNGKKPDRKNPDRIKKAFAAVITEYTSFTEPIILVAENQAEDKDLDIDESNGFYLLPNGEHFPYNIFKGIQLAVLAEDGMGENIIRAAYKDIKQFGPPTITETGLIPREDQSVERCEQVLDEISRPIERNDVNLGLAQAWTNLEREGRTTEAPNLLVAVQRTLQRKGIVTMGQLPQNETAIMKLVQDLPRESPLMIPLLQNGLGIQIPRININTQAGYGFNVFEDSLVARSIFQRDSTLVISPLGFSVPADLTCFKHTEFKDRCDFFKSRDDYLMVRMNELGVSAGVNWRAFSATVGANTRKGYNIESSSNTQNFTATREIRLFSLDLHDGLTFTPEFEQAVNNLPKFDENSPSTVGTYRNFISQYGTHVISSSFGGGCLEITASRLQNSSRVTSDFYGTVQAGLAFALLRMFDVNGTFGSRSNAAYDQLQENFAISFTLRGGNFLNDTQIEPGQVNPGNIGRWQDSLVQSPMMLQSKMKLMPLSYYVNNVRSSWGPEIERALKHIYGAELQYQSPTAVLRALTQGPPPRDQEPVPEFFDLLRNSTEMTVASVLAPFIVVPALPFIAGQKVVSLFTGREFSAGQAVGEALMACQTAARAVISGAKSFVSNLTQFW